MIAATSYARNFWSSDTDASVSVLVDHFRDGTKTVESLLQFYKERLSIEEEYTKRLNNLTKKSNFSAFEHESSTLRQSLSSLIEETRKLSESHSSEAQKLSESVYKPLGVFLNNLKKSNKPWESTIIEFIKYKDSYKSKVKQEEKKYEAYWNKLNGYKTQQIMLDDTEAARLQKKIDKCVSMMIEQREKYYKMVNQYNRIQESFKEEWCRYCQNSQLLEEERIKYIRRNAWEYANAISSACIGDDQTAENIRLCLEKCLYQKDIEEFISMNGTGDKVSPPMQFVDFAKGETRASDDDQDIEPISVDVDVLLKSKGEEEHRQSISKQAVNKKAPPKPTEQQQTAFDLIDRSSKTFEELELQAEKKATAKSQEDLSEPSTYKVMSDYSGTTGNTSVASGSAISTAENKAEKLESSVYSNPLLKSQSSAGSVGFGFSLSRRMKNIESNDVLRNSADPLKAYLNDLSLGGNGDMSKFRESMNGAEESQASDNRKAVKVKHMERAKSMGAFLGESLDDVEEGQVTSARKQSNSITQKRRTSSMRRAKSQENLSSKFISSDDLPSRSSEGFSVIKYCRAQFNYESEIEQELSFRKRDILLILHQQPDGWWFAENINTGDSGLAPSNYLADL
ncbi:DEKNAAC102481 [Brettanomyces naardenensis]|uniref:DEKNAAC102481 n=1 Tax=Brettanomyces naardenensis TaxID=13370 RepID=A0A448YKU7_BRENA|nr:DEKNAAC102481 [Brettanomyces naardenensis]